jgi:primosomal protein N''
MVTEMDDRAREIFAAAYVTLERVSDIKVTERDYSKPDAMEEWRRGMPPKQPEAPTLTRADVEEMLAYERAVSNAVHGQVIAEERQRHRVEMNKLNRKVDELGSCLNSLLMATRGLERCLMTDDKSAQIVELHKMPAWGQRGG